MVGTSSHSIWPLPKARFSHVCSVGVRALAPPSGPTPQETDLHDQGFPPFVLGGVKSSEERGMKEFLV